ncbi:MAG: DNA polymerase III subunit alpha [Gammaproteobacteria bacterium]|nr:MAG: DNA polymerase III subunit alpha [Gammaproteobacteria bacterium]
MPHGFVHLRLHTEYSLSDSVVRVPELVAAVAAAGMPAVAVTDQGNLFAMVKFYREALKAGVKPLVGVDLLVAEEGERQPPTRLTLLCQSPAGYRNLARLVSRAYLEGQERGTPRIERGWLSTGELEGLIGLSCAAEGDVGRALIHGREGDAERSLEAWLRLFPGRFYLELQRLGRPFEETYIAGALALAGRSGAPVVASNDVRFLRPEQFESHEARVCIHDGTLLADAGRVRRYSRQQYLRTPQEMAALFADVPEALANSVEIARRCSLTLTLGEVRLPQYPLPAGVSTEEFLRAEAARGLTARFTASGGAPPAHRERLERELQVICQMGFAGYFLIVADFIRWAREHGVPVGPGRGSGAGSLVAYSLRITDLDPLRYDLLFERFLNPERVSMPDFDIDFCMDGRDKVIDYVAGKYGRERVSQIITYGTMAAKAVVRDVGRVLGMSYGYVDRIAKLIPFELGITLDGALEKEPELKRLYQSEDEVRNLIDLARSLEGLTRNAGMHAGGVVIAPSVLTDFAPLYRDASGGNVVTQFDKDDVEAAGLVKFDFLGLRTLTIIERAAALINRARPPQSPPLTVSALPMDDAPTYALLKSCRTTAVFQLESRGMKDLIRRLQPDCFEDIVALVALFRPGPLQSGMVDDFINRKHGRSDGPIDYLHPSLEPILKPTYGVILYQEQVMQIAQVLAGYTLGGADLLRRAMGKKSPEEMAQQRSVFVSGAVARGVREQVATHIFDLMEKFAGYGFNKSHSAAYALLAYQTAYLKAHYPAAFMAAVLSAEMGNTDKVVTLIKECTDLGLAVLPPDVNASGYEFAACGERSIRYGLGAVRGVGEGAAEALIAERSARGAYSGLEDLCRRLDLQKVNRRVLEALLRAGSLDGLGANRAKLMERLSSAMHLGDQNTRACAAGQNDLFGLASEERASAAPLHGSPLLPEWSEAVRLAGERETLGLYLTGHPLARFESSLARFVSHRIGDLVSDRPVAGLEGGRFGAGKPVTVAGLIDEVKKRGPRVILTLDDRTGRIEAMLFEETWQKHRDLIAKDALVLVEGLLRFDEFSDAWRLSARRISELDEVLSRCAQRLVIRCTHADAAALCERLATMLTPWRGGPCPITIEYTGREAHGALTLGGEWSVRASRELLEQLEGVLGRGALQVIYGPPAASPGPSFSADAR